MSEHTESKLYLPKHCIVPLEVRLDDSIPDGAKIYLGELNVLANKFGYVFASDEALAEMKGMSVRSIERWHEVLEKGGHIYRQTWREHYKDDNEKGVKIKSKRRIYIGMARPETNKDAEPTKMAGRSEPTKMAVHCEPPKMAGINKEQEIDNKENNNEAVVVPLCLDELKIPQELKQTLAEKYKDDPKRIEDACKSVARMKPRNLEATIQTALTKGYSPGDTKEECLEKNREWARKSLAKYDGKKVGTYTCSVLNKYVEFSQSGVACAKYFNYEDASFQGEVTDFMKKNLR